MYTYRHTLNKDRHTHNAVNRYTLHCTPADTYTHTACTQTKTHRQTDTQTDRQTDRHTHTHTLHLHRQRQTHTQRNVIRHTGAYLAA